MANPTDRAIAQAFRELGAGNSEQAILWRRIEQRARAIDSALFSAFNHRECPSCHCKSVLTDAPAHIDGCREATRIDAATSYAVRPIDRLLSELREIEAIRQGIGASQEIADEYGRRCAQFLQLNHAEMVAALDVPMEPPSAAPPACDNPSGMWCKSCRGTGVSHCSDPVNCGGMKPMSHHDGCRHTNSAQAVAEVVFNRPNNYSQGHRIKWLTQAVLPVGTKLYTHPLADAEDATKAAFNAGINWERETGKDAEDAARYRFLRDRALHFENGELPTPWCVIGFVVRDVTPLHDQWLDAEIDGAMEIEAARDGEGA